MGRSKDEDRIVYSTDRGRICPECGNPADACTCKQPQAARSGDGRVRVARATQGRKGKGVTVITGLPLAEEELKTLAKKLKALCGAGGAVKDGIIEIQGEHRDRLVAELIKRGFDAKRSGG